VERSTSPSCGSEHTLPIICGLPTRDLEEAAGRGELVLGDARSASTHRTGPARTAVTTGRPASFRPGLGGDSRTADLRVRPTKPAVDVALYRNMPLRVLSLRAATRTCVRASRRPGEPYPFDVRVWCGRWERDVPVRTLHVRIGWQRPRSRWSLSAVVGDVKRRPVVRLPRMFVGTSPRGRCCSPPMGRTMSRPVEKWASSAG
jgi:hypothetical protein